MATALGYKTEWLATLEGGCAPVAREKLEKQQGALRTGVVDLLSAERAIPLVRDDLSEDDDAVPPHKLHRSTPRGRSNTVRQRVALLLDTRAKCR